MRSLVILRDFALDELLPYIGCLFTERIIERQIDDIISSDKLPDRLDSCLTASLERVKQDYQREKERRKGIEDKARSNLVSITLSFAVLGAALGLIKNGTSALPAGIWSILFVSALELGFLSLLLGGLAAAQSLRVSPYYQVSLSAEVKMTEDDLKWELLRCTALNQRLTTIRSNYCDASFTSIRNGVICMAMVGGMLAVPLTGFAQPALSVPSATTTTKSQQIQVPDTEGGRLINWDFHLWDREDWAVSWSFLAAIGQIIGAAGTVTAVVLTLGSIKRENRRVAEAKKNQHNLIKPYVLVEEVRKVPNTGLLVKITNRGIHAALSVRVALISPDESIKDIRLSVGDQGLGLEVGGTREFLWVYNSVQPKKTAQVQVVYLGLLGAQYIVNCPVTVEPGKGIEQGEPTESITYPG